MGGNDEMRMKAVEALQELLDVNHDSLEISTAARGGGIKIYMNFAHIEECKKKINNAFEVRKYANEKLEAEKDDKG